ncbi:MAG: Replication-associated recombination protein A [Candidatus Anoxychlamydiales bacterium]|nr:Replication-associated recombination protein A [Candidatus Anoxychlamydiales bacterium]
MNRPLSDLLRPSTFDEVFGHEKAVFWLKKVIISKKPLSILFFGPAGSGKTTLAKLYAKAFNANFIKMSGVFGSTTEIKKIALNAQKNPLFNIPTILFVDEIHRFNKAQQDSFLPFIEDGTITLIGATTENPSFSLNNALISRFRVIELTALDIKDLSKILTNYEKKHGSLKLTPRAKEFLLEEALGDARHLLNMIENLENLKGNNKNDLDEIVKFMQKKPSNYDKASDIHYNLISALHKSIRGSDVDAALYWLSRMLNGKEDPLYITRRLIRISLEDISLADVNALKIANLADETYRRLGSPEGELAIAEATIYLALAPKSNKVYEAFKRAQKLAEKTSQLSPPKHILNAPTKLMKDLGYSKGYKYDHDEKDSFSAQNYFPENLPKEQLYFPKDIGFEKEMKKRYVYFDKLRKLKSNS